MKQQFHKGDLVKIKDELSDYKSHFDAGCYAIIYGSYRDKYGGGERQRHTYTVLLMHDDGTFRGRVSWYDDDDFDYLVENRCETHLDYLDYYEESLYEDNEEI